MGGGPVQQGTQQGTTQTSPWGPTKGSLQDILGLIRGQTGNTGPTGAETDAFNQLQAMYGAGNPYAAGIGSAAQGMLGGGQDFSGGVNDAYNQFAQQTMPWASGAMGDPNTNPALRQMLDVIRGDTQNSVNSQFAAAGRDMSGMNSQALARGLAQGEAPTLLNAQQMGLQAAQNLLNAGNQRTGILSGLQQNRFANQQAGTGMAANALAANQWGQQGMLANEMARRGLPLTNIANLNSLLLPIAGLGGKSTSAGATTQQTQVPAWQQALGAGMGATGMLGQTGAFGSGGWLGPGISAMGSALGGMLMPAGALSGGLGGAAALPLLFSDRRLKRNVEHIGDLPNGLPVYFFNYLWSDEPRVGLMADEVEKLHPHAVFDMGGYKAVNYAEAIR